MASGEAILQLLEEIASWKPRLKDLGPSYNGICDKVDKVELATKAFMTNASIVADAGNKMSKEMVFFMETVSDTPSPRARTIQRMENRLVDLKEVCENMTRYCQLRKNDLFKVATLINELQEEIILKLTENERARKKKSGWRACISRIMNYVISVAGAFSNIFDGDTINPLKIGGRILTAAHKVYAEVKDVRKQYKLEVANIRSESNLLENISLGITKGAENITAMGMWWDSAQREIIQLETSSLSGLKWGANEELDNDIRYWETLGKRFTECSGQMGGNWAKSTRTSATRSLNADRGTIALYN